MACVVSPCGMSLQVASLIFYFINEALLHSSASRLLLSGTISYDPADRRALLDALGDSRSRTFTSSPAWGAVRLAHFNLHVDATKRGATIRHGGKGEHKGHSWREWAPNRCRLFSNPRWHFRTRRVAERASLRKFESWEQNLLNLTF